MARVIVKQCFCGKIYRRNDGEWKHTSRITEESLKDYTAKGITEIVRVKCDTCAKEG